MTTLDDWTDHNGEPRPVIKKRGRVLTKHGERTRTAGWWGPTNRGVPGFVTVRDSHEHRIRKLDAYAISTDVLDNLERIGVEVVLIVESDTDTVLEYRLSAFTTYGTAVPDAFLSRADDPQRYVERGKCWGEFRDHASNVYVPRDGDV